MEQNYFRERLKTLRETLGNLFGPKKGDKGSALGKELNSTLEIEDTRNRQLELIEIITDNLKQRGVLATPEESVKFYLKRFHLSGYEAPEIYQKLPGGATVFDEENQQIKIYLNPYLKYLAPLDYQLMVILEEAIHWSQLKHSGRKRVTCKDEVEAKEKLLRLADFLGFDDRRRKFLEEHRKQAIKNLSNNNQSHREKE